MLALHELISFFNRPEVNARKVWGWATDAAGHSGDLSFPATLCHEKRLQERCNISA